MKRKVVFLLVITVTVISTVVVLGMEIFSSNVKVLFTNVEAFAINESDKSNALKAVTYRCGDGVHEYISCEPGDISDSCGDEDDVTCPPNFSGYDELCPAGGYHSWKNVNGRNKCTKCNAIGD